MKLRPRDSERSAERTADVGLIVVRFMLRAFDTDLCWPMPVDNANEGVRTHFPEASVLTREKHQRRHRLGGVEHPGILSHHNFRDGGMPMPRSPRADEAGGLYHAMNRGNLRPDIFKKEADYAAFERILHEALEIHDVESMRTN